jgi:hypothetical protein
MKKLIIAAATCSVALNSAAIAGSEKSIPIPPADNGGFELARRPISNPTLFDLALPKTGVHLIYMHHRFPNKINTTIGKVDLGGDLNLVALQFEYAFNERLSLVALKDGYVDFNPDNTAAFNKEEGFANIGAGLKYAFILDRANQYVLSGSAVVEFPTGSEDIFQGEGDGFVNLSLQNLKLHGNWQFAGSLGVQIPLDSAFSTQGWAGFHASYEVTPWFIPLIELNYFRVLDDGNGHTRFSKQVGGLVPAVAESEGADLLNLGAANSQGADYATMAVGFRSRLSAQADIGFAYEFTLTGDENNLTKDRFTFDLTYTF